MTIVPAYHWSTRAVRDRRMALWSGFMLHTDGGCVYFAGDTGYGDGQIFREMRIRLGRPDLALIPIGAYAPRWFIMREQHVDPDEAVQIVENLEAVRAIGIHWGTFQLTSEAWASRQNYFSTPSASAGSLLIYSRPVSPDCITRHVIEELDERPRDARAVEVTSTVAHRQ